MSEPLTREEIRRAGRAVGWEGTLVPATMMWFTGWSPDGDPEERFAHTLSPEGRIVPNDEALWDGDALALLEAAVREGVLTSFALHYDGDEWTVTPENQGRWIPASEDPALPTAAVRAILQATQTPGEDS